MNCEGLKKLKVLRKFEYGIHAAGVYLLEGKIVKKVYPSDERSKKYFNKEIEMMEHLQDCKNVAKLIAYDRDELTLYMTYCGKTPEKTPENLQKIRIAAEKLHKKWGVVRHDPDGKVTYDIFIKNTGIIDGKIYFFDLASSAWKLFPIH